MTWIPPYRNFIQQTLPLPPCVQSIAWSAWDTRQRNLRHEYSGYISESSMAGECFNFCIPSGEIEFNLSKILCGSIDGIARVCAIRSNHAIKNNTLK